MRIDFDVKFHPVSPPTHVSTDIMPKGWNGPFARVVIKDSEIINILDQNMPACCQCVKWFYMYPE
jgi:hypothetical protein